MIFHENRLLADDSHVISYLIFVENWERRCKMSAAVVIGALRVKSLQASGGLCCLLHFANCLDPDQDQQNVGSVLDPNCLTLR